MTGELSVELVGGIAVFVRVGGFVMLLPAFSGAAVPAQVRLLMVLAISLPLFGAPEGVHAVPGDWRGVVPVVGAELLTGMALGMMVRLFFLAISFVGDVVGSSIGLAGMPGTSAEAGQPENVVAALVNWAALVSFLLLDLHHPLLRAIAASFETIRIGDLLDGRVMLVRSVDTLTASFVLAARLGSPFLAYAILVNFAAGLLNKLVPQIPTYFVSMPVTLAGGLLLLLIVFGTMTSTFGGAVDDFIASGLF